MHWAVTEGPEELSTLAHLGFVGGRREVRVLVPASLGWERWLVLSSGGCRKGSGASWLFLMPERL